jgi:hypothetical protein
VQRNKKKKERRELWYGITTDGGGNFH